MNLKFKIQKKSPVFQFFNNFLPAVWQLNPGVGFLPCALRPAPYAFGAILSAICFLTNTLDFFLFIVIF